MAPPPTAQTPGPNWLIFWLKTPHVVTFRITEAIFEFHPRSWDMSKKLAIFAHFLTPDLTPQNPINRPISRLPEWNSKIASVILKVTTWGVFSQKMSQFGPGVWAVGGGCHRFWVILTLYFAQFCIRKRVFVRACVRAAKRNVRDCGSHSVRVVSSTNHFSSSPQFAQ